MSEYPTCKHGNNDPMIDCKECEITELRTELNEVHTLLQAMSPRNLIKLAAANARLTMENSKLKKSKTNELQDK